MGKGVGERCTHADDDVDGERPTLDATGKGLTVDEVEHQVRDAIVLAVVAQAHDRRVPEALQRAGFTLETAQVSPSSRCAAP